MADGGFLVKFDGKDAKPCYAVAFDYDRGTYTLNDDAPQPLPPNFKTITITIDKSPGR